MSLTILRPGLLTTVQDLGRTGYQKAGILVSGAMDTVALRVGNLLVGNAQGAAGLEITLSGPRIRFEADHIIALTGAHLSPTIDGRPAPRNRLLAVRAGAELAFGAAENGCRAYLAVSGSFDLPRVLGSHATYLRAGLGGLHGRALRAGDVLHGAGPTDVGLCLRQTLPAFTDAARWVAAPWSVEPAFDQTSRQKPVVRAIVGPEYGQFSVASQQAFWSEQFTVTAAADRMGYRLSGPALQRLEEVELLSSAVTFGTVQVPAGGQAIVLMADHQTTGGYPRLAQVISVDFSILAQLSPGQAFHFQEVSLAEAQALYLAQERRLQALRRAIAFKLAST